MDCIGNMQLNGRNGNGIGHRHWLWWLLLPLLFTAGCAQQAGDSVVQGTGTTLCYVDFQRCVNPILEASLQGQTGVVSCAGSACHETDPNTGLPTGSGGDFHIYPNAESDSTGFQMQYNFTSARGEANLDNPSESKLLLKPSATGRSEVGHAGGNIFPTNTDACHVAIQTWISTRVADENDPNSCGFCVAPDLSTCGY
jgi:hypothetical protein